MVTLELGGELSTVDVQVDATPLLAQLAEGEGIRVIRTESDLAITRPDGTLLLAHARSSSFPAVTLPLLEGFDASMAVEPSCELEHSYSQFCDPAILQVGTLLVSGSGGTVAVDSGAHGDIETASGAYRVHNLVITSARHPDDVPSPCALILYSRAEIAVVRVAD